MLINCQGLINNNEAEDNTLDTKHQNTIAAHNKELNIWTMLRMWEY